MKIKTEIKIKIQTTLDEEIMLKNKIENKNYLLFFRFFQEKLTVVKVFLCFHFRQKAVSVFVLYIFYFRPRKFDDFRQNVRSSAGSTEVSKLKNEHVKKCKKKCQKTDKFKKSKNQENQTSKKSEENKIVIFYFHINL